MMHFLHHRASGVSLRELLPTARIFGASDIQVRSCCSDSRRCQPGDLFVAILGSEYDGHDYYEEAIRNGAVAILAERQLPVGVPTCIVDDSRIALGFVCHALAGAPSQQMRTIGVAGTFGKTVTSMLIAGVLEAARNRVGMMGSLGYCDTQNVVTQGRTTPPPPDVAMWLTRMANQGCSHAVLEASADALARHFLCGAQLDAALITNLRGTAGNSHGDLWTYREIQSRVFGLLKPEGFAVLNADDPASQVLQSQINHPTLTVSMKGAGEVNAELIERHVSEQTFFLVAGSESIPVRTRMIGVHHVYNCLSAAAVGLVMGIDLPTIARGLESVDHVPGRLQRIEAGQDFGTFVDGARTPETLTIALKTLRPVTKGRLICVYGAEGEKGTHLRPLLGRAVERNADIGIITNNSPRSEAPLRIAHDILDGYDRPAQAQLIPDRARAICWALHKARPGDTVLVAGRGSRALHVVGANREAFDDRDVCRELIRELAKPSGGRSAVA
ncbi:MAG: UDP-N-acetylmuramoyl-L-alanyl-D-glutamate--2,6-diaminopimelate ligase [Pirellulaceae bacterium]|nr:UDP-N-acetylmuramoyl-L-alanyl-D-glutamate--2,6-diaminopimelate ligase [Planctomycetales bacterium]